MFKKLLVSYGIMKVLTGKRANRFEKREEQIKFIVGLVHEDKRCGRDELN